MLRATKLAKPEFGAVSCTLVSVNTATPWQLQCWRKPSQTVPVPSTDSMRCKPAPAFVPIRGG